MDQAIDYAGARPSPSLIKARGYKGVLRYVSHSAWKNITKPEFDALHAEGLTITLNWETTEVRPMSGADGGAVDGKFANKMADDLGYPKNCAIYYSLDTDDRGLHGWQDAVSAYLRAGAAQGRPAGIYGSVRVVNEMARRQACSYFWQCKAWSGNEVSTAAHLYQLVGQTTIADTDVNNILRQDYGQYPRPSQPVPHPSFEVYDMFYIGSTDGKYHLFGPNFTNEISGDQALRLASMGFPHQDDQNPLVVISMAKAVGTWKQ